ncbi:MAG: hypothetical protein IIA59_12055 [Candidatus Marinimicrobia bacterium]|nr:hypothetical protein [Candidatus Neomarinimicrobiota bacterium]
MERKKFITTIMTAAGLMPLVITQIGCTSATDPTPAAALTTSDSYLFTSSIDSNHSHTVEITFADLSQPPEGGRSLTTSSTGHTHSVTLSTSDFAALEAGQTVIRNTSNNSGHRHTFSFVIPETDSSNSDSPNY